jgi:hypothetical protein
MPAAQGRAELGSSPDLPDHADDDGKILQTNVFSLSLSSRLVSSRVCIIIINIIIAGVVFLLRPSSSVETNTRRNSNNMLGLACFLGRERWEGGCLPAAAPIATC